MKPDRIKISHEFPGFWLAVEIPIAPDEDVVQEFKKGKSLLLESYRELTEPNVVPISEALGITQVNRADELSVSTIESCPDLTTLESFRLLVVKDKMLKEAYDVRFELLKNK